MTRLDYYYDCFNDHVRAYDFGATFYVRNVFNVVVHM